MKYEKKIGILIFCFFIFLLILGATLGRILTDQYPYPELKILHQAFSLILSKFVDPIDNEILLQGAEKGLLYSLDSVNIFIPKEKVAKFEEWKKKPLYDCGIRLKRSGRFVYVSKIYPSSTAEKEFQIGDIIEEVNGLKYPVSDLWELELEMRGEVGKNVKIHFTPVETDDSKEVLLKIKPYEIKNVEISLKENYYTIKINEINSETPKIVKNELKKMPKNITIVLDLRNTSSLDYESSYKLADLFVKGPFSIILKEAKGNAKKKINDEEYFPFEEIYVLQDEETFGSAEILASILEKKAKAKLVGTNTYGYVGIPKAYPLSDKSIIYLTSTIVFLDENENLMKKGLKPTIEVKKSYLYSETYKKIEEILEEILKEKKKEAA